MSPNTALTARNNKDFNFRLLRAGCRRDAGSGGDDVAVGSMNGCCVPAIRGLQPAAGPAILFGRGVERQGQLTAPRVVGRQVRQRRIVDQPHRVVDGAQVEVPLVQLVEGVVRQLVRLVQVGQQPQRILVVRVGDRIPQLKELDDEVDVEQTTIPPA